MIISGLLSTMNVWVDKYDDIRFSINDLYMTLLMTGWMFLLMGIYYKELHIAIIGLFLVTINMWCIRTQFMVNTEQYILGMIPHHSMAILMSKKLIEKNGNNNNISTSSKKINEFANNIIKTQEYEIELMKNIL